MAQKDEIPHKQVFNNQGGFPRRPSKSERKGGPRCLIEMEKDLVREAPDQVDLRVD